MAAVERVIDGHAEWSRAVQLGQGFADLARRMTWNEWMARWDSMEDGTEKVHVGRGKNPPQRHS